MDTEEALKILFGDQWRDLMAEGYQTALAALRQRYPSMARQVERALEPCLRKAFPRRSKHWHDLSTGMRARLALLPENPHLVEDVHVIRSVLGIPAGEVRAKEGDRIWQQLGRYVRPELKERAVHGRVAEQWLDLHRRAALGGRPRSGARYGLSWAARQSAIERGRLNPSASACPEWLRRPPRNREGFQVPMEWAVARLLERYRLPEIVGAGLQMFILTQDVSWLRDINFGRCLVAPPESLPYRGFSVTVSGLYEFVTREDWSDIWDAVVKPRQGMLMSSRGMAPAGRRTVDIERLRQGIDLCRKNKVERMRMEQALSEFAEKGSSTSEDIDLGSARRLLRDLKAVLAPVD